MEQKQHFQPILYIADNVEHAHLQGIARSSVCWLEWQEKCSSLQNVLPPIYQITAVAKVVIPLSMLNHIMRVL